MSDELKSAFDIDGFLEGTTKIECHASDYTGYIYYIKEGVMCFDSRLFCGERSYNRIPFFLAKKFSPVVEKTKTYRYDFRHTHGVWDEYKVYVERYVITKLSWDEFVEDYAGSPKNFKILKTTEVRE